MRSSSLVLVAGALGACSPPPPAAAPQGAPGGTSSAQPTFASAAQATPTAAISYGALVAEPEAPLSLTASDGSGLELVDLDAKVVLDGPLAFTELHLRFRNPEDRIREGRFAITLPTGAAISRFAMETGGRWMEAEMVERSAARQAYEDFLHRRQDPALLEQEAGNEFRARVFPIPARGEKDLIVSYSQELASSHAPYVLPLRGLPAVGRIAIQARVSRPGRTPDHDQLAFHQERWKPDQDFAVSVDGLPAAVRNQELVAVRIAPAVTAGAEPAAPVTILFDTSASRALGFDRQVAGLGELVAALRARADFPLVVAAFDQDVQAIFDGNASAFGNAELGALRARQALGASDLGAALAWVKETGRRGRVVVVGDGVVTAGAPEDELAGKVRALAPAIERLDVVLAGGIRDDQLARGIARGVLARDGAILDLDRGAAEAARRLGLATRSGIAITVPGARWSWPERLDGIQPGDEAMVYAVLDADAAARDTVAVKIGADTQEIRPANVVRPLVRRAAAQAEVARLEAAMDAADRAHRAPLEQEVVALSTRERVLSSKTALLVLETDQDYARFGIDRRALADILAVGANGIELQHRAAPVRPPAQKPQVVVGRVDRDRNKDKTAEKKEARRPAGRMALDEGRMGRADEAPAKPDERQAEAKPEAPAGDDDGENVGPSEGGVAGGVVGGQLGGVATAQGVTVADSDTANIPAAPATAVPTAPPPPPTAAPPPAPAPVASATPPAEAPAPRAEHRRRPPAPRPEPPARRAVSAGSGSGRGAAGEVSRFAAALDEEPSTPAGPAPLEGDLAKVMADLKAGRRDAAMQRALRWHKEQPGDVLGLIALGESLEASKQPAQAARAYGSIIDLFPARADLRRFAGERLERVGALGRALAIDSYQRAVADRPDHLTGHRLLAYALVRAGRLREAFAALEAGATRSYPGGRFAGGERVLREDLGLIGAAWLAKEPSRRAEIERRLAAAGARLSTAPSTRFVLYWETDANDVDFHIHDARGGHAFYSSPRLPSGGELYADITTGYGPECFTIPGRPSAGPYKLQIHYYSRGPMGYGMGLLEILRHDGKGGLSFEHRPYVIMTDGAFVDLGTVGAKTAALAR